MSRAVLSIGNFDGVHVGHRELIRRARIIADRTAAKVIALAFDPHPTTRLRPASAPARITTFDRRAELLKQSGAEEVVRLEPSDVILSMAPDEFVSRLVRDRHPVAIVEGPDFNYGKGRAGSVETLIGEGKRMGFSVEVVHPVEVALSDLSVVRASSTLARHLIAHGRIRDASLVLGRPHEITGTVTKGDQRGRTIGFPTANLVQPQGDARDQAVLLPPEGVYAGRARLPDGRTLPCAINVGSRPTFDAPEPRIEAHVIDPATGAAATGLPEYGWPLTIELIAFIRDTVRFGGIDALRAQLVRDRAAALRLAEYPFAPPDLEPTALVPAVEARATRTFAR